MEICTYFEVKVTYQEVERKGDGLKRKTLKAAQVYKSEVLAKGEGWDAEISEYEVFPVFKKVHV